MQGALPRLTTSTTNMNIRTHSNFMGQVPTERTFATNQARHRPRYVAIPLPQAHGTIWNTKCIDVHQPNGHFTRALAQNAHTRAHTHTHKPRYFCNPASMRNGSAKMSQNT